MNDFMSSFERGAMLQKLQQNQRDMKQMSSVIAEATVQKLKLQKEVKELKQKVKALKKAEKNVLCSYDQMQIHNHAEAARSAYLLGLLDQAHGPESNPARQLAHPGEEYSIPSGDRKGQPLTQADAVYLTEFAKTYNEIFKEEWGDLFDGWVDFINKEVSY